MKIKSKNISLIIILFTGLFFALPIKAATQAEIDNCKRTGGSGLSKYGNCENCPSEKTSNNGVCVDPIDTGPSSLPDATIKDFYGNEKTPDAPSTSSTSKAFKYTLLESFPGFFTANTQMTDFQALVLAIYKFGIWTVGIAGMFMMTIGGIMYMTSAGNKSTSGSAKDIIWDAIYGIIAALAAYLVLYVINPDLTKININFTKVTVTDPEEVQVNGTMSGTLVSRDGKQIDESFAVALDIAKQNGIKTIVTSGLRSLDEQIQLIRDNCGGYPPTRTCSTTTCLLKNGPSSCPHTTGRAADIWALDSNGRQALSKAQCQANIAACFNNPYQKNLVASMRSQGFCVLSIEPWHFEKPKMSTTCN